ncbi:unnamed protein product, partial [Medioppia subpectinata]
MSLTKPEVKEQFIPEEHMAKGSVDMRVYWHYMKAGAGPTLLFVTFFRMSVNASTNLHNTIFSRLMTAPIAFFDINPIGFAVNNRFTNSDINSK